MMEGRQQAITAAMTGADAGARREAYNNLSNLFAENGNALDWNEHMGAAETRQVLQNLKVDLTSHKDEEVHEAAGLCVHLLASPSFLAHVGAAEQKDLCDILVTTLKTNKSRKITDIVLQSLAKSRLKREAYLGDLQDTFKILREILQMKDLSASVVCEALQVVLILLNAEPGASVKLGTSWFPSTFSKMFHANLKVRNSALEVTAKVRETMEEMATPGVRSDLITMVMADLKDKYCKDMARMVLGGSYTILQVWREVVSLLGTELHSMRSLTNLLLNVVEKAFKISEPEVRVESFNTWRVIIDNFALDKNTLTHQKKLQLLLAPLKVSNSRTEEVCSTKLHIWWHLVCLLADQKCLAANFDLAAVPLLQFCFIGGLSSERDKVGRSNRNLIMSGAVSSPHRTFGTLHGAHAEILAQLLTSDTNVPKYKHSSVIHHHLMSPALFMRHYPLLLRCFSETVQTLDFKDVQQNTLGKHIFSSLLGHIRAATVPNVQKKEVVDVVRELFSTLSHLETLCHPGDSQSQFLFIFFSKLIVGDLALPKKVLNSHQYHIPACGSVDAQDIMCGTLSNHLITQLCRPPLLHHALTDSNFVCVWSTVLENSQPVTGKLRFLQAAVQELSASAVPFLCPGDPLVLCDLWNAVLRQMLAHIDQMATTGDCEDSEPDWACVCSVLHFPVIHATEAFSCAPFDIFQHIMETWRLLWHKLTLLTSSTRTVEPNSEVEHVASTLLAFCQDHNTSDTPDVHMALHVMTAQVLVLLTETFSYHRLGDTADEVSPSPAKAKKKPHPLHNLASTMVLTVEIFERICSMVSRQRMYVAENLCQAALNMMKGIPEAPSSFVPEFITIMMKILLKGVRVNPAVVFDFKVERKFIGMLKTFTTLVKDCIARKGSAEFVAEHLSALDPLFSAAFISTNEKVKVEVQKLIESCIASVTAASLDVPSFLLDVQTKWDKAVRESASVNEADSMEDFIQATPREKRESKSLPGLASKVSSNKKNTPLSARKLKLEQLSEKKQGKGGPTPPTRYSARVRKSMRSEKSENGDTSSISTGSPATPDVSSVASSASPSKSVVKKAMRTSRSVPSPQKREGKHTTSQSASESQGKEQNKAAGDMDTVTGQLSDSDEPIIISTIKPEKITKDCDKAKKNLVNGSGTSVKAEKRKSSNQKQGRHQQNGLSNHSEKVKNESFEGSEVLWGPEQSPEAEVYKKANVELCAVLHDASRDMQKMLDDKADVPCVNDDQASSPHKKSQTATHGAPQEISPKCSVPQWRRINFMEVTVSPSVVKDAKLAQQRLKVKITSDKIEGETPQPAAPASDSDDEILGLPDLTSPLRPSLRASVCDSGNGKSDKKELDEKLPVRLVAEDSREGAATQASSGGKRKRKLFSRQDSVESSTKKRRTENTTENHDGSDEDSIIELESSRSEEIVIRDSRETPKSLRKTKSYPSQTHPEKEESTKTKSAFSPKVTRSGRKIVAPNKDIPQPITPKKSKKKLLQKGDSETGGDISFSSLVSTLDDSCDSLTTEGVSRIEGEMEVDGPSLDKVSIPDGTPKKCNDVNKEIKETEFDFDESITIIGTFDASTSKENSISSKSKRKEQDNHETPSRKTQKDSVEVVEESPGVVDKNETRVEDRDSSLIPLDDKTPEEDESMRSEMPKSKSGEPEKTEPEKEEQPETGKGMDVFEDSPDPQKTSEESSTPMECGQDLHGEVSYPAARRGTEIHDDTASGEAEDTRDDVAVMSLTNSDEEMELRCVRDDKGKGAQDKDVKVPAAESESDDDKEEVEEDRSSSSDEEDRDEAMGRADTPASPEPEEEEEEEEYISAGQEKEEEKEVEQEKEEKKIPDADMDKMHQETPNDGVKEPEEGVPVNQQEQENLQRTDNTSDKKKSKSECDSKKYSKLSSEKITIADIKGSVLKKVDTSSSGNQDQRRDSTSDKEVEGMKDTDAEDGMDVEDPRGAADEVEEEMHEAQGKKHEAQGKKHEAQGKKHDQQHSALDDEAQREQRGDGARTSRNGQDNEVEETPCTTKDSDERNKIVAESSVCDDTLIKKADKSHHVASSRKQLLSEKVDNLEGGSIARESSGSPRKGTQATVPSESAMDEVTEMDCSPSKNVEVENVVVSSDEALGTNVTVFSPKRMIGRKKAVPVSGKDVQDNLTAFSPSKTVNIKETVSSPSKTVNIKETVSSPSKTVNIKETVSSPSKTVNIKETVSSPSKTVNIKETVSSPSKTVNIKETVSSPSKTVNIKETVSSPSKTVIKETVSSPRKTVNIKETVSSPSKNVIRETVSSPRKTVNIKETVNSPSKTVIKETVSSPRKTANIKETVNSPSKTVIKETVSSPRKTVNIKETVNSPSKTVDNKETVSSPRKTVNIKETVSSQRKTVNIKETVSSQRKTVEVRTQHPKKTVNIKETVSSQRKTVEVRVPLPKKTVLTKEMVNIAIDSDPDQETVPDPVKDIPATETVVAGPMKDIPATETVVAGPMKDIPATETVVAGPMKDIPATETVVPDPVKDIPAPETTTPALERTDDKLPETSSDRSSNNMEEDETEPEAAQHTEGPADTPTGPTSATSVSSEAPEGTTDAAPGPTSATSMSSEAPEGTTDAAPGPTSATSVSSEAMEESPINTRQQEEELSPDKSARSRLKLAVSTPERMRQRGAGIPSGSRAAFLVACAKKNIKNRAGGEGESPGSVLTESGRSRSLGQSPSRRSGSGRPSPSQSPDQRRKSLLDSVGMRPWVKHTPSPGASPSPSILKRTLLSDGLDGDTPSPPAKYRRVSFADPPVSERVEIPPSPRTLKGMRAQKRLDMTRMATEVKDTDEKRPSQEEEPESQDMDASRPFFPSLAACQDKVERVAQHLTSAAVLSGLMVVLGQRGISTVGQLSKLSEYHVNSLPVRAPKVTNTRRVLKDYEKMWKRENIPTNSPAIDEVEVSLARMFGELDDKENLRPNHQDSSAPEVTKAEAEARESAGRSSHSDNMQEIMDMEDITPLDSSPEETEEETVKSLYRRASEDNLDSQIKLLQHLLQTLPSSDVAEAIAQCIKTRMTDPAATT